MIHNNTHSIITSLLNEEKERLPEQDTLTVVPGFIGAYPETFLQVDDHQIDTLVNTLLAMNNEADYASMMDTYGIRRTDASFWQHADAVLADYTRSDPITGGLLDFNRLENR